MSVDPYRAIAKVDGDEFVLKLTPQAKRVIGFVVDCGLYGQDQWEVVNAIFYEKLREIALDMES